MKVIELNASKSYKIKIGSGLLQKIGTEISAVCAEGKAVIVSDSNVYPLYGAAAAKNLQKSGFSVMSFVFTAGEASKNAGTYLHLLNFLAENQITRSDFLVALGGGVVGDLTGFAAATYLRGIPYIQIPTTLLAAVDSSVGGKTAIDLDAGKNLAGSFYQPSLVLCDTDALLSLPLELFRDGCAEVIKYAVLYDPELFSHLRNNGINFDREAVIARCVKWKRDVVAADEFDTGERMKLNLGHTIGHGIEACSNFTISHGKAVAAGMAIVSRAALSRGICSMETMQQICGILTDFGLPTSTRFSGSDLCSSALADKKRAGNTIRLIVPSKIGDCSIYPIPVNELKPFVEAGL